MLTNHVPSEFYKMLRDFGLHAKWILRFRRLIFRFWISTKWHEWKRSNQSRNSSIYDVHSQFAKRMDCTFDTTKKKTNREFHVTLNRSNDQRWLFPFEFRKREKIISMHRAESNCMLAASESNVRFAYRKFNRNFSIEPEISGINEIAGKSVRVMGHHIASPMGLR